MSQQMQPRAPSFAHKPVPIAALSFVDVDALFRILRFIASHPELAAAPVVANPTSADALDLPSSCLLIGTCTAVGDRLCVPPQLEGPLEDYRRMATTAPINKQGLEDSRARVQRALEELCSTAGDAAATAALHTDVLAHTEDVLVESDTTPFAKAMWTGSWGPKDIAGRERISNNDEMQQIVPGLWCGSWRPASNLAVLKSCGVTHVCCCIDTRPHFPTDVKYWKIPAVDTAAYRIEPHFAKAFEFIEKAVVLDHGNVLVHCGAGISRAPTIVTAYLMRKLHISSTAAVELVKHRRMNASPNLGFREQLREYGKKIGVE